MVFFCRLHAMLEGGNGDQNTALLPVIALPAWLEAVNAKAVKEWYAGNATSLPNWVRKMHVQG